MTRTNAPYRQLVVFGDSFSDWGNLYRMHHVPVSPPCFAGRFSNGPVWVEHLASRMRLPPESVANFAVGGATTGTANILVPGAEGVLTQVMTFVSAPMPEQGLYILWAGTDEFFHTIWSTGVRFFQDVTRPAAAITTAITNVMTSVRLLVSRGARALLVPTIPALGRYPKIQQLGNQAFVAGATALAVTFNKTLRQALQHCASEYAVTILSLDVFTLFENVMTGSKFVVPGVERAAVRDTTGICSRFMAFWQGLYPTTAVHTLIAEAALKAIQADADCGYSQEWAAGAPVTMQ